MSQEIPIPAAESVKFPFKCRAAIMEEFNKPLVIKDVDIDEPQFGECFVKVAAAGVCHSDLHMIKGDWPALSTLPMVLGHEGAGVVVKCGPGVTRFKPGDNAIFLFIPNCGTCESCQTGRPGSCSGAFTRPTGTWADGQSRIHYHGTRKAIPAMSAIGLFSEYTIISQDQLVPIKKSIPLNRASLVGCAVMTGVGAVVNTAKATVGTTVVVVGCGGVGLNAIQGARIAGCDKIIGVDLLQNKLDFAKQFGATHVINGNEVADTIAEVHKLCPGGVDYVLDCIGNAKVIEQGFMMIKGGGTVVAVGIAPQDQAVSINAFMLALTEKKLAGSLYGSARPQVDMPRLLNLYEQKRLMLDELVSKEYTLDQINEGFDLLRGGAVARGVIKMY
ncbi:alcohol dehydrogenase [Gonapodya prolifera JEL478]|uniref:Alcohol dehydrogenase n=1 Tax=Gonapodya prolifera (strain JEL478) TaxID=1344416 RepID=A0A139AVE1_GONPJ|nr:alcohol dehydrogenase [Gonapodya prolifera JEL478]|eukprot:KXS20455.1 alcohol dehydrogenase [Gonapodya prolifera JEL478]